MKRSIAGILAAGVMAATPAMAHAQLGSMSYQYFKVQNSSANPDFGRGIDGGIVTGLVKSTLGPDGLPVVNGTYGGPSGPITQVNGANELLWWTANGSTILADGSGTIAVPFSGISSGFFATGETSNANWYRTAIFQGFIDVSSPTSYNFSLGSDDDAWLFIDGQLVGDNGGVKALGPTVFNTGALAVGNHTVDLFFADRHQTESGITFDPRFAVTSTPEPASFTLVGTGLAGLFGVVRRKRLKV